MKSQDDTQKANTTEKSTSSHERDRTIASTKGVKAEKKRSTTPRASAAKRPTSKSAAGAGAKEKKTSTKASAQRTPPTPKAKEPETKKTPPEPALKKRTAITRKQPAQKAKPEPETYIPRILNKYRNEVVDLLVEQFGYKSRLEAPRLTKISLNIGVGRAKEDPKDLESAVDDLTVISGQRAVVTTAKKSVSNFKIRQGDPVGCRVTIRHNRMYEFLDRMISLAIPRFRDFNGLRKKSFDGEGNYSFGIKEQIVFPEIDYDKVTRIRGLDVTISTSANSDHEALALLQALGMPFRQSV